MSDHYDLDKVLQRHHELIIPVRGRDFKLWRVAPNTFVCRIDYESKRYTNCTFDDIKADLDNWRPGDWVPCQCQKLP